MDWMEPVPSRRTYLLLIPEVSQTFGQTDACVNVSVTLCLYVVTHSYEEMRQPPVQFSPEDARLPDTNRIGLLWLVVCAASYPPSLHIIYYQHSVSCGAVHSMKVARRSVHP